MSIRNKCDIFQLAIEALTFTRPCKCMCV